jgi:hypothetical protein
MAKAEGVERGYVGSLLRLTLLPPPMVEAIVAGRQLEGMTLPRLLEGVPVEWGGGLMKLSDCRILGKIRDEKSCSSKRWVPCVYQSITVFTLDRVHHLNGKCANAVEPNGERTRIIGDEFGNRQIRHSNQLLSASTELQIDIRTGLTTQNRI